MKIQINKELNVTSMHVSNPKDESMMGISLPIVLGITQIDIFNFLALISSKRISAALIVPKPPIIYTYVINALLIKKSYLINPFIIQ